MAIDRDPMGRRTVPGQGTGPVGMNEPTFRMEMPRLASVLDRMQPMPGRPAPMPMQPGPRFPMEPYRPPPGMAPFNPDQMPRPRPRRRKGLEQLMPDLPNLMERPILPRDFVPKFEPPILPRDFEVGPMQPAAATIDPSDYRTIIKMIEQGLDPNDYMNRGGIASLLQ